MKTKTCLLLLVFSIVGMTNSLFSQEKDKLDGYWYLNENTDLEITAYYDSGEKPSYYEVQSFYGIEFDRAICQVKGNKIQFCFMNSKTPGYYDEEEMDTVGTALFQVLTMNDSVLSLRPLDVGAVRFLDQIQQQGYTIVGEPERNEAFYTKYWNEVSKAKGKKRETVINKWKTEHHLFVDEAVFHEENWYTEIKDPNDYKPLIDSIYYSEILVSAGSKDSVHYADYKIYGNGSFVMRQFSAPRSTNDGIPDVIYDREDVELMETVQFIPPVVTEESEPQYDTKDPLYEDDEPEDPEFASPPAGTMDSIEPPLEEVYDGYKSDIEYFDEEYAFVEGTDADGYYKGTFSEDWMNDLNAGLNVYGPSRQVHLADSTSYTCNFSICGKKHIRVFYNGTHKDFWVGFHSPILLYSFLADIAEKEGYYTSFEQSGNKTEKFPLSFRVE